MASTEYRGLRTFIADIRNCQSKESERERVQKEMANIRAKFHANKNLDSYQMKKYVWKMIYMFMLGYEIDFGHMQVINLISSPIYSEKQVGYVGGASLDQGSVPSGNRVATPIPPTPPPHRARCTRLLDSHTHASPTQSRFWLRTPVK